MTTEVRFEEAIAFLRRRLELPADRWLEVVRQIDAAASDRSAGMTDSLVTDILAEVLKAIEDGSTFDGFLDGWIEATRRHGWTAGDDFESAYRARLAFRLMTSQAYAAGRWQQIQRLKRVRPYLRYVHVDPELTQPGSRHEHAAWHGIILPVDHEWWLTHYPPNGWNCRCYVQSLSERDLGRYGWRVSEEAPPDITVIQFVRGVPVETPAGIDPGFAFNVGVAGLRLAA
ncbi:phage head morphogenesis protein [Mesorhizobium australicum]|uniref:Phage Mu protein F like protein n=1 Tax=Mesorhizobium australicum TaxID=536018 RepID=A0A1X7NXD2_9HYPH|nr:phage minor head protein [Mesorhizobium australicum]SMH42411.1 Phage Mu protein F like protein [Mesorhizobium australicum]